MRFDQDLDSFKTISDFRRTKAIRGGNQVAELVDYVADIHLSEDCPIGLNSIRRLRIQRRWIPSSESFGKSVWFFGGRRISLEKRHFEAVTFTLPRDDKGHTLSVLSLLALKRKLDSITKCSGDGFLFRSELLRLASIETWQGRDTELDRILSGMKRYTTTGREKPKYYSNHPLRDRFLLADNEIYNLVCWAGSGKPRASGRCLEKGWIINIDPEQIRVFDENDSEMLGQRLKAYLDLVFPRYLIAQEEELSRYREMIERGDKPWFEVGAGRSNVVKELLDDAQERLIPLRRQSSDGGKPRAMIDFGECFRKYEVSRFVGRVRLLKTVDEIVEKGANGSPFVLIVGEAGIGKTALMAKWIADKKDKVAYYFCEERKRHRLNAKTFTKHLVASLGWIHGLGEVDLEGDLSTLIELMNKMIAEICSGNGRRPERAVIAVDALDECLSLRDEGITIVDVLRSLDQVEGLRVVVSSRETPELNRFVTPDRRNVILMTGDDPENQRDIEAYYREHLGLKRYARKDLRILLERTEGNFLYAALSAEMVERGEATVAWLLENAPKGLTELYEWKLEMIRQRVRNEDLLEQIWLIMRAISLIPATLTPRQLSEILNLDPLSLPQSVGPLKQFLDLDQLEANGGCRWFHKSFDDFVIAPERLTEQSYCEVYSRAVRSCQILIQRNVGSGLPEIVPGKLVYMYSQIGSAEEVLSYVRNNYVSAILSSPRTMSEPKEIMAEVIGAVAIAVKSKRPEDIVFFQLLLWSLDFLLTNWFEGASRQWPDAQENWNERIEGLARKLGGDENTTARIAHTVDAYLKGAIGGDEMSDMFYDSLARLKSEFTDVGRVVEVCEKYARECGALIVKWEGEQRA